MTHDPDFSAKFEAFLDAQWLDPQAVSDEVIDEQLALAHAHHAALQRTHVQRSLTHNTPRNTREPTGHVQELIARLAQARVHPSLGNDVSAYFRRRDHEDASEQELQALLDDFELLQKLNEEE
jgi:hypothetical protein